MTHRLQWCISQGPWIELEEDVLLGDAEWQWLLRAQEVLV